MARSDTLTTPPGIPNMVAPPPLASSGVAPPQRPFIYRALVYMGDAFAPAPVRAWYNIFLASVDMYRTLCVMGVLGVALIVAEWEQPGWFPTPGEVGDMLVCLLVLTMYVLNRF
jgi:hypothetical protein